MHANVWFTINKLFEFEFEFNKTKYIIWYFVIHKRFLKCGGKRVVSPELSLPVI